MVSSLAHAAEWTVDASIKQDISYNNNVRMQKNARSSVIYQLVPVINFAHRTEMSEVLANVSYGTQRYLDIPELDRNLQNYALKSHYFTEISSWGLNASLNVVPVRNIAEQDSGNFASNAERTRWSISPSFSYKLTELDSLTLLPDYSKTTYSSDGFSDNDYSTINLAWEHQWSERYLSSISFFYSKFDATGRGASSANETNSTSYGVNILNSFRWSENLTLTGSLGVRLTDSKNKTIVGSSNNSSAGFLADITVNYKGENYSTLFNLNRSLMPLGTGQLSQQSKVSLNLHYDISERLSASIFSSYQITESASSNQNATRKNLLIQPAINWKMAKDWTVSASYIYRQQNISSQNNTANSNSFVLSISYNWQGLSFSR